MKSEIDELLRKRELFQSAFPSMTLIAAMLALAATAIASFTHRAHIAAVMACSFAAFSAAYLAFRAARTDLEIVDKLSAMESRLQELEDSSRPSE